MYISSVKYQYVRVLITYTIGSLCLVIHITTRFLKLRIGRYCHIFLQIQKYFYALSSKKGHYDVTIYFLTTPPHSLLMFLAKNCRLLYVFYSIYLGVCRRIIYSKMSLQQWPRHHNYTPLLRYILR